MSNGERVHVLAKKLGMSSTDLVNKLNKEGITVKSHMNLLDEETSQLVLAMFGGAEADGAKVSAKTAKPSKTQKTEKAPSPKKETAKKAEPKKAEAKSEKEEVKPAKAQAKPEKAAKKPETLPEKESIEPKSVKAPEPVKAAKAEKEREIAVVPEPAIKHVEAPAEVEIEITEGITVKELAVKFSKEPNEIIKKLISLGVMATINQLVDFEIVKKLADLFNLKVKLAELEVSVETIEAENPAKLKKRPPVVTIMGHVDHGKTSLLDAIRETNIIAKEAGGITQHIGAYHVELDKGTVVFLDTPGHHAFTAMRARGASVTDIVVLVVAADDGAMPQTIEAIDHAKVAKVPIIVAVNKIDKPNADPQRVRQALADHALIPEEWGGNTVYVDISAKRKTGINDLLELILLQAELLELKANPDKKALGAVVEAKLDKNKGPLATVLIQSGTLKVGDAFVAGVHSGKVRALFSDQGKKVIAATPSMPVMVLGFSGVPEAGDSFVVVEDERKAKQTALIRMQKRRDESMVGPKKISLEELSEQIKRGIVKELNIILKTDVQGSAQALEDSITKLATSDVKVKIIHTATGGVTESDVILASAANSIIIGFNVRPEPKATALAERERVDMRFYTIIYDVINDIRAAMEGLLEPTIREKQIGRAEIREVFNITKVGAVAGCYVLEGKITRTASVRLVRDNVIVYKGKLASLKRFKDDVREVLAGYECGTGIENFNDIKASDIIEAFIEEKVERKL